MADGVGGGRGGGRVVEEIRGRDMYYKLLSECNPDEYFEWIRQELVPSIADYDEEMAERVNSWIGCTSSWLKRYEKFASGAMTDAELYRFYGDTLKMFDVGIEAREMQKSVVDDEVFRAEELYENAMISDSEYEDILSVAESIKEAIDNDIETIKQLKAKCLLAKDRIDVVACIESVANATHERGSMLPVMCGAYLQEDIVEAVTDLEESRDYVRPEDVGYELSVATQKVLNCVREFGKL